MRRLLLVLFIALWACAPGGGPSASWQTCVPYHGVDPYGCDMTYTAIPGLATYATGGAWTTEPPTTISIRLILEHKVGDQWSSNIPGGWTHEASNFNTQVFQTTTAIIQCERGLYRWHMEVHFDSKRTTTFTKYGDPFVV